MRRGTGQAEGIGRGELRSDELKCFASLIGLALLCFAAGFIPGSYVSWIIYHTWKGTPGYSYDQIPSYDD